MWNIQFSEGSSPSVPKDMTGKMEKLINRIEPILIKEFVTNRDFLIALNAFHSLALNTNVMIIQSMAMSNELTRDVLLEYKDAQFDLLDLYKDQLNTEILKALKGK